MRKENMNNHKRGRESRPVPATVVPACAALLIATLSLPAFGQSSVGLVGGVTRDSSSGKPVAKVQIVAHNLSRNTDRTTVSDADEFLRSPIWNLGRMKSRPRRMDFRNRRPMSMWQPAGSRDWICRCKTRSICAAQRRNRIARR